MIFGKYKLSGDRVVRIKLCGVFKFSKILLFSVSIVGFSTASVLAQIVPDNTLGNESSTVTAEDALTNLIEGGAIRNNNLFHSFL